MLASFPGSSAPERDIEVVHAERCLFRVPESLGTRLRRYVTITKPAALGNSASVLFADGNGIFRVSAFGGGESTTDSRLRIGSL